MNPWNFIKQQFGPKNSTQDDERALNRLVEAAISLLQVGNYFEARKVLLRTMEYEGKIQNPEYLEWILGWLSATWEQTEEYQEWTDFFSGFIARNPAHSAGYRFRAQSLWYAGRIREAIDDYSRVIELNPNDAWAFSGRGQLLVECDQFGGAVEDLHRALSSKDDAAGANQVVGRQLEAFTRNGLAAAYAGLGDFDRASGEFEKSIALCPENAWVYFNRAKALYDRGDHLAAAEDFSLSLKKTEPKLTALKRTHARDILNSLKT